MLGLLLSTVPDGSALAETMTVSETELPVVTAEPAEDGVFVVRARAALAGRYRRWLLSARLDRWEREYLAQNRPARRRRGRVRLLGLPAHLLRVQRDSAGRLFLYKPCDGQSHRRYVIAGDELTVLGGEPSVEVISEVRRLPGGAGHELVTDDGVRVFRRQATPGLFEETDEQGQSSGILMTPRAARKLDLVVNVCRGGKRLEFSFGRE